MRICSMLSSTSSSASSSAVLRLFAIVIIKARYVHAQVYPYVYVDVCVNVCVWGSGKSACLAVQVAHQLSPKGARECIQHRSRFRYEYVWSLAKADARCRSFQCLKNYIKYYNVWQKGFGQCSAWYV